MKKITSILALVIAMTMVMSVSAFAAATFSIDEADVDESVTLGTVDEDSIALTVDATDGAYYSILLVDGTELPTVDSTIAYINQATAADGTVAFDVLPLLTSCSEEMTLYIGTNAAGESLIDIPVAYAETAPAGPNVTFMNGAETVATLAAADGAVVAPAGPATVPTPGVDALISSYEFVGWTDADGETIYETDDSIPVTEEMTLYAKYQMYNTVKSKVVKWGDIDGNGLVSAADVSELINYYEAPEQCTVANLIKAKLDADNMGNARWGDVDGNNIVSAADVSELINYYEAPEQCTRAGVIKTSIYFINE